MIEHSIIESLTERLSGASIDIANIHDELSAVDFEYDDVLGTEIATDFDSSNLEDIKERIKAAIENLQNIVSEIDDIDL